MINTIRWTFLVTIIGLAAVICCTPIVSAEDLVLISIDSPKDRETIYFNNITVSGFAAGTDLLNVESVTVNDVRASGTPFWSCEISLQTGRWNTITAKATVDSGQNDSTNITVFCITPPSAPQNLQLTAGDSYVNLGWIAPHDDGGSKITKYNIYRRTAPGGERLLKTVYSELIHEDHDVTNDQKYYYQVSAVNSAGEGEKSMEAFSTPKPTPISTPISTPTSSSPEPPPTSTPTRTNLPPVCSFRCSTKSPEIKELVEFDASDSCDHDGKIIRYLWDFGDGKIANEGIVVSHSYSTGGACTVKLIVMDDGGAENSTETIIVINRPPKGSCEFNPRMPETNELIAFDATSSEDPDVDGYIEEYMWDFGDGKTGRGRIVNHNYSQADKYDVKLTVTDDKGAEGLFNLTVYVKPPPYNWGKIGVFLVIFGAIVTLIGWILKKRKENRDDDVIGTLSPVGETLSDENLYGSLIISSNPSGAIVYLDGNYKGETPMNISGVVVGLHSLKLTKRFYADVEKRIQVSAGIKKPVDESLSFSTWVVGVEFLGGLIAILGAIYAFIKYLIPFIRSMF